MAMSRALVQVLIPAVRRFRTTVTTDILSRARERPMFADLQEVLAGGASDHTLGAEGALETDAFDDAFHHQLAHDLEQDLEQEYALGLDVVELKEVACQAMVHLAMQNQRNKLAIVRCPGVLPALRHALLDSAHPDLQDTAAMVIANCADNFAALGGQEAASIIVATPGLLSALCSLVCQSVSSFSDSADRSAGLAAVISLSDHACILHHLRAQGFPEALQAMLKVQPILLALHIPQHIIYVTTRRHACILLLKTFSLVTCKCLPTCLNSRTERAQSTTGCAVRLSWP